MNAEGNVTVAYVSVCKRCGMIGGASNEPASILTPPGTCYVASADGRHLVVSVPVVVPIP